MFESKTIKSIAKLIITSSEAMTKNIDNLGSASVHITKSLDNLAADVEDATEQAAEFNGKVRKATYAKKYKQTQFDIPEPPMLTEATEAQAA